MADKGIPVIFPFGGHRTGPFGEHSFLGQMSNPEIVRRNRLTVAVETLEDNREELGQTQVLAQAQAVKAELESGPRWDEFNSRAGTFFRNLWGKEENLHYFKYVDLTARLRELTHWAQGGTFDPTTSRIASPHSAAFETIRQSPAPVAERISQIAREDVIPAAQRVGSQLQKDAVFRKRFLIALGVLILFIIVKRI